MAKKIKVKLVGEDAHTAYISLSGCPDEPKFGVVSLTLCLDDLIPDFKGPRVNLDFNSEGELIGVEILA